MTSSMVPRQRKQHGISVLSAVMLVIVVLPILVIVFYEERKAYWDWRVKEMCEKDGGVCIFERVRIIAAEAALLPRSRGNLGVASDALIHSAAPVYSKTEVENLSGPVPQIQRREVTVIRRSDSKVVAR